MDTSPGICVTPPPESGRANGSFLREFSATNSLNFSRSISETSATDESFMMPELEYSIATHFVKVKRSGTLTDVTTLWDLVGTDAVSGSLDHLLDVKPGFERLPSINAFDKVCTTEVLTKKKLYHFPLQRQPHLTLNLTR